MTNLCLIAFEGKEWFPLFWSTDFNLNHLHVSTNFLPFLQFVFSFRHDMANIVGTLRSLKIYQKQKMLQHVRGYAVMSWWNPANYNTKIRDPSRYVFQGEGYETGSSLYVCVLSHLLFVRWVGVGLWIVLWFGCFGGFVVFGFYYNF